MAAGEAGVRIKAVGMAYHLQDAFIYLFNPDLYVGLTVGQV
ncbi:MAG: hypothetical protein ACOC58_04700 [Chloroflexota bacterium]